MAYSGRYESVIRARTKPLAKSALALPILDMMRNKFVGETNAPHMVRKRRGGEGGEMILNV